MTFFPSFQLKNQKIVCFFLISLASSEDFSIFHILCREFIFFFMKWLIFWFRKKIKKVQLGFSLKIEMSQLYFARHETISTWLGSAQKILSQTHHYTIWFWYIWFFPGVYRACCSAQTAYNHSRPVQQSAGAKSLLSKYIDCAGGGRASYCG